MDDENTHTSRLHKRASLYGALKRGSAVLLRDSQVFEEILTKLSMATAETRQARALQIALELRVRGLTIAENKNEP